MGSKENAETYARGSYPDVLKALEPVVEGTPQVQTYDVSNSTFHRSQSVTAEAGGSRPDPVPGRTGETDYRVEEKHHDYRSLGFVT